MPAVSSSVICFTVSMDGKQAPTTWKVNDKVSKEALKGRAGGSIATQAQRHEGFRVGKRWGLGHTGVPHTIRSLRYTGHKYNGLCIELG